MTGTGSHAVRFDRYGDRSVLYVADVPVPAPEDGEVVVEVKAAAINPGEAAIRSGALADRFPATFPSGEGSDLAGIVSAVGHGVDEFAVGDAVLGFSFRRSSHATYVSVPTSQLIHKPPELSWEVAGSLYVVGCTAYAAVRAVDPKAGEKIAVSAAAGGVGTVVVQLLALRDAHVLGIASPANADWLRSHGAVPVAYGEGLLERLRAAAGGKSMRLSTSSARTTSSSQSIWAFRATASRRSHRSRRPRSSASRQRAARPPPPPMSLLRWPILWLRERSPFRSRRRIRSIGSPMPSPSWNSVIPGGRSCFSLERAKRHVRSWCVGGGPIAKLPP